MGKKDKKNENGDLSRRLTEEEMGMPTEEGGEEDKPITEKEMGMPDVATPFDRLENLLHERPAIKKDKGKPK